MVSLGVNPFTCNESQQRNTHMIIGGCIYTNEPKAVKSILRRRFYSLRTSQQSTYINQSIAHRRQLAQRLNTHILPASSQLRGCHALFRLLTGRALTISSTIVLKKSTLSYVERFACVSDTSLQVVAHPRNNNTNNRRNSERVYVFPFTAYT